MNEVPTTSEAALLHPVDVAAKKAGGRDELAELLGVTVSALGNWKSRGVPPEHCQEIRRIAGGEVTLQQLRPNDWRKYWPEESAETQGA